MFSVSHSGIVTVNRGDSFELPISLNIGTVMEPIIYTLTDKDAVYVGVMEPNQPFETAIVRKRLTISDMHDDMLYAKFKPKDTSCLLPGKYYYQVKLVINSEDEHVFTIVDKTLFYITE